MSKKKSKQSAKKSLSTIAEKNGISVESVRQEIELAIAYALENPDPKAQAFWHTIPRKGETPTPEEVIAYVAEICSTVKN